VIAVVLWGLDGDYGWVGCFDGSFVYGLVKEASTGRVEKGNSDEKYGK
jgi:hypothetical protein